MSICVYLLCVDFEQNYFKNVLENARFLSHIPLPF